MKNLFLNFDVNNGLGINTFRNANGVSCVHNDLGEFLQYVQNEINSSVSIDLIDVIELLESGSYWNNSDIEIDTLEHLYRMLKEYQAMKKKRKIS